MTQYSSVNVKLSNLLLNKLKSKIKNGTEVTLNHSSNVIGDSNNETNFPHKLLLTNGQVSRLRKVIIKLSKTQVSKMVQLGGFLQNLFLPSTTDKLYGEIVTDKDYPKSEKDIRKLLLSTGLNILSKNFNEKFYWLWVQE